MDAQMRSSQEIMDQIRRGGALGASAVGRAAAHLLAATAGEHRSSAADAASAVRDAAAWLLATRPSMSSTFHPIGEALRLVSAAESARTVNGEDLAATIARAMLDFVRRSVRDLERLQQHGAALVSDGATIVVHSYSATVVGILRRAAERGTSFSVRLTESRPRGESRHLAAQLAEFAIELELHADSAMLIAAKGADLALVGADAVLPDGSFLNKVGTHILALACKQGEVRLYAAAESSKWVADEEELARLQVEQGRPEELAGEWDPAVVRRIRVRNPLFEIVPSSLVNGFITERGLVLPSSSADPGDSRPQTTR